MSDRPFTWGTSAVVTWLVLKGWVGLIFAFRFLRRGERATIRPGEWGVMGIGYCIVAVDFVMAAITGDGWQYGLIAIFL